MADMTVLDYAMMVEDSHVETRIVEYRRRGPTPASTAAATARSSPSASPTCSATASRWSTPSTSPTRHDRSLGTFMILDHIRRARRWACPIVYLGYWVDGSKKMAYKARFTPQERLLAAGWERVG